MSKTYTATDVKLTINGQTISVNAVGTIHDEFPVIIDYPGNLVRETCAVKSFMTTCR